MKVKTDCKSVLGHLNIYLSLTKPRVLFGNAVSAIAGFLLASHDRLLVGPFIGLAVGSTLIIASACVVNNILDRDIDAKMKRTKNRVTVTGVVSLPLAALFGIILGLIGLGLVVSLNNLYVVSIGLIGWITYVVFYGMTAKRLSIHGTLVGSISGAVPIAAGYLAVSDRIDMAAILVFLTVFFWQLPEFYSIAIYRLAEYKAAGVPVMPAVVGVKSTKLQIMAYSLLFVVCSLLISLFTPLGYIYIIIMALAGLYFIWRAFSGLRLSGRSNENAWARQLFHLSINWLLLFCLMIALGTRLP